MAIRNCIFGRHNIFSKTIEDHIGHIKTVLDLPAKASMSLQLRKCFFLQNRVEYLGHIASPGKLSVARKICDAVLHMEPPTTFTELKSFLGLCNVYRRFVEKFAHNASPLTKKRPVTDRPEFEPLNDVELEAFEPLKLKLV